MKKRFYTYRVTFPGFKWYYYGYHRDNGKPYFGSPVTHKWIWEFYDCEVQILEWFDTLEEALKAEYRLIRPFLSDPFCLNEHCGGFLSSEARRRGSVKAIQICIEHNRNLAPEERFRMAQAGGLVGGASNRESGHAANLYTYRDPQEHSDWGKQLASITNSSLYECPCCGKRCNIGGMMRHLKAKQNTCWGDPIKL